MTIEGLKRGLAIECGGREDISDMCRVKDGPSPEGAQEATKVMATECPGDNGLVTTLKWRDTGSICSPRTWPVAFRMVENPA